MNRLFPSLLLLLTLAACGRSVPTTEAPPPPNVLFIAVDDLRPEIHAYGKTQVSTPNLDRLIARGMRFDNAYCNVPVCGASRASIMSGMRPRRNRFVDYTTRIDEDAPDAVSLHGHFKANGYHTASLGKVLHDTDDREADYSEPAWHPGQEGGAWRDYQSPENQARAEAADIGGRGPAFERAEVPDTAYFDGKTATRAAAYLARLAPQEQPFFLAVGFLKPHLPFNAPAEYWDRYDPATIELPPTYYRAEGTPDAIFHNSGELRNYLDVPEAKVLPEDYARRLIHGYYAATSFMDAQLGKVLDALEATGEADNTIIILWGDHGWNLGDHTMWCKHSLFNTSLRTPLVISAPGYEPGSTAALVEFVDIFPTLADLAGLDLPEQLDGKSLTPLLTDPDREWTDAVYTRWKSGDNITTERYSYSEWYDDEGNRYARALFDHRADSLEVENLAERAAYHELVAELSGRLLLTPVVDEND